MLKVISTVALFIALFVSCMTTYASGVKPIYVVHVNLGNKQLSQTVEQELLRSSQITQNRPVIVLRPDLDVAENPFAVSRWSHQIGFSRMNGQIKEENTPVFSAKMIAWFENLEAKDIHPEVFILNGHHLVGMGFQSDNSWETKFKNKIGQNIELANRSLFFQTIIKSQQKFAVVRRFFEGVKLAFIGGCEGLSNLEPKEFGLYGRALAPLEIKEKIENGQAKLMLGDISKRTGLAYYKYDLAKSYPGDFTANSNEEVCIDTANNLHCEVYYTHRILPDSGLWDGTHAYNMPLQMKKLFPKALGIFGFNTPSPLTPGPIWQATFNEARQVSQQNNILLPLLSDEVSEDMKRSILQNTRISWTKNSYRLNKKYVGGVVVNRVSGSITPAYPDLDQNGLFAYALDQKEYAEAPAFAPYEIRTNQRQVVQQIAKVEKKQEKVEIIQTIVIKAKKNEAKVETKVNIEKKYNPKENEDPLFDFIRKIENKKQSNEVESVPTDIDYTK
ncbi:MAG: hypothetical protein WA160_03905 [Pseudobdellovibrio sp.]